MAEASADGTVTAVGAGKAEITAATAKGIKTKSTIIVKVPLTGISIDKTTLSLLQGETWKLKSTIEPKDTTEDTSVTWTSSNAGIATVDNTGKVTAVSGGTAVITVRTNVSGKTAACKVTVKSYTPVEKFVIRLYKNILGRGYDDGGLKNWADALTSRRKTGAEVAEGFVYSKEFIEKKLPNEIYVETMYETFLGRGSDPGGKSNWIDKLEKGMSREWVFKGFVESNEFSSICQQYGIERGNIVLNEYCDQNAGITQFVYRCYQKALGRTADKGGLNNWCEALINKRQTPENVAKGFIFSEEMNNKHLSNTEFVKVLYRVFMGREYDEGGLKNWVEQLNKGISREKVFEGFAGSNEFKEIVASYGL